MDKRLKQKMNLLKKIFNFLRVDIRALDHNEKRTLIGEMLPFFMPPFDPEGGKSKLRSDLLLTYEKMRGPFEKQSELEEMLIKENIISHVQGEAKNALSDLITKGTGRILSPLMACSTVKNGIITNVLLPSVGHDFKDLNIRNTFTNIFLINLNSILNEIPLSSIKICPNCEGHFLNLTRRRKDYCSPHCTWRAIARKKKMELKKHPRRYKAYKTKQAEIMWRRYEEKQKAEYGPKVKIRRRVEYGPKGKVKARKEG